MEIVIPHSWDYFLFSLSKENLRSLGRHPGAVLGSGLVERDALLLQIRQEGVRCVGGLELAIDRVSRWGFENHVCRGF